MCPHIIEHMKDSKKQNYRPNKRVRAQVANDNKSNNLCGQEKKI